MQEFNKDQQIFNDFNSSQCTELLGIKGCFTAFSFGVSPAKQQQQWEEYDRTLEATDNIIVFEECDGRDSIFPGHWDQSLGQAGLG
jgi:hypothetical protein